MIGDITMVSDNGPINMLVISNIRKFNEPMYEKSTCPLREAGKGSLEALGKREEVAKGKLNHNSSSLTFL